MKKYPKLKYPDHDKSSGLFADGTIFVQEKLDGANFRFCRESHLDDQFHTDDRAIVFGSRNVAFKNQKDESKQFKEPIRYVREQVNADDIQSIENTLGGAVTVFGEAMTPHTLTYNFSDIPAFVGFDMWDESRHRFVPPSDAKHFIEQVLGLDFSPILDKVPAEEWDDYSTQVPQSAYGDVKAEGLVLKNPTTNVWSKMVREDFKEKNKKTFGKPKKHQESGAEKLSYQYITNARIKKQVHKLIDEGDWNSMQMEMMEELPEAVIRDMAEEEAANILMNENWEVDIGDFRSITSSRCARVLRKMINEKHFE
jgi:hypothetical protein